MNLIDREKNTITLTDDDLKPSVLRDFKLNRIDFYDLSTDNFNTECRNDAIFHSKRGVNILLEINNKKRLLILSS